MKLVIFIGHFKTGSSSIQSFLSSNFLRMMHAGILYPSVESQGIAHNMRCMMSGRDISTAGYGLNIIEPHNALALRLKNEEDNHGVPGYYPNLPSGFQMLELIGSQISALAPKAVILCSEVFALFGMTEKHTSLKRLANRYAQHDVTIYCNLRRPDEYLSSWHRQRLKFNAKIERLSGGGLHEYIESSHVQHARMIEAWLKYFPGARLVLRNFDDVKVAGGSVYDFIAQSGLPFPTQLSVPKDQNPSVPSAFAEVGRRAVHELPRELSSPLVTWLTRAGKRVDHPSDNRIEMFGTVNRSILMEKFRPVAAQLDKLNGGHPFYQDVEAFGRCNVKSDIDAAREALPALIMDAQCQDLAPETQSWLRDLIL